MFIEFPCLYCPASGGRWNVQTVSVSLYYTNRTSPETIKRTKLRQVYSDKKDFAELLNRHLIKLIHDGRIRKFGSDDFIDFRQQMFHFLIRPNLNLVIIINPADVHNLSAGQMNPLNILPFQLFRLWEPGFIIRTVPQQILHGSFQLWPKIVDNR